MDFSNLNADVNRISRDTSPKVEAAAPAQEPDAGSKED